MTRPTPPDQPSAGVGAATPPADIAAALDLLDGVAAGADKLDIRVAAASAAAHLRTARPPYPPPRPDQPDVQARTALPAALRHLTAALDRAGSVDEAMRIGDAIDELHDIEPDALTPGDGPGGEP